MLIPFLNGLMGNDYANIEYVNKKFNNLLHEMGVESEKEIDLSIKKQPNYRNIVLLVYNLSRAEFNSREFLINEINSIREIQKDVLYTDRKKVSQEEDQQGEAEEARERNRAAAENLKKLNRIDCGFDIKTYSQRFYPFSADSFHSKQINFKGFPQGLFSFGFERSIKCKLFWETDNEYSDGELDWPAINEKGLRTRYLYRDRNSYTHHVNHASVDALLKPKSWKNLLRALSSFYYVLRIAFVERIGHRGGSKVDIRSDDTFFQNLYLQLEVEEIYDVLTRLIQRKAGVAPKRWVIFDESKYDVRNPKTGRCKFLSVKSKEPEILRFWAL